MDPYFSVASLMEALYHLCDEDCLQNTVIRVVDENRNVYGELLTVRGEVCPDGSASITLVVDVDY